MIRIENFHGLSIADMTRKYKGSKNKREAERWLAVKMIAMDHTVPFVASILGHDERSIRSWIKGFNDRGSEGLIYELFHEGRL